MPEAQLSELIISLAVYAIPAIFAITLHEAAHAWMARRLGDRTAEMLGRLTANPLKHIDPTGTIIVPLLTFWFGGVPFGWAKPVPIDTRNLRNPKKGMVAVALAGPGANLLMAYAWALLLGLMFNFFPRLGLGDQPLVQMALFGIKFNTLLMVINLLPILPLDGGRVLRGYVPESIGVQLDALERYGIIIALGFLLIAYRLGWLEPIIQTVRQFIFLMAGL